jgi:hypothetical protein
MERQVPSTLTTLQLGWQRVIEPLLFILIASIVVITPSLMLLNLISIELGVRILLAALWPSLILLALRLPRLLQHTQRRLVSLVLLGTLASAFVVVGAPALEQVTGTGATATAAESLTFRSPPRISRATFAAVLQRGNGAGPSPAAPYADELYDIVVGYGLDPAVALAFFAIESQMGNTGVTAAYDLKNWGGTRRATNPRYAAATVQFSGGSFVRYNSWQDGLRDWCELIIVRYINRGLDTVEKAIPVYAPSFDGNIPDAYISSVYRSVSAWQGRGYGVTRAVRRAEVSYTDDLPTALLKETFASADTTYYPEWAFHKFLRAEASAGRPLGAPLGDSRKIEINGKLFVVQPFALDTLYTPLADDESKTNWGDVRRMSDLLKQNP